MKKIRKETALFVGTIAGMAFLTGMFLGSSNNWDLIMPMMIFNGIIFFSMGLLLFGNKVNNV